MTRISSAPPSLNLNPLLDQIGSQAGAAKDNGNTAAFDSHLERFSRDAGGEPTAEDANSTFPALASGDAPATGQDQPNSVSALFAALTGDTQGKESPASPSTDHGSKTGFNSQLAQFNKGASGQRPAERPNTASSAMEAATPSEKEPSNSVSTLFAALTGNTQSDEAPASALAAKQASEATGTNRRTDSNPDTGHKGQVAAPALPPKTSIAFADNTAAGTVPPQMSGKASGGGMPKDNVPSPAQPKPASQNSDAPVAADTPQPAAAPLDPSAAAQAAAAMMAKPLGAQDTIAPQALGKLGGAPQAGPKVPHAASPASNASASRAARSSAAPASGVQSQQDSMAAVTQKDALNLSTNSSDTGDSSSQTIKMKLSSIQAQTHLAPVQHLSPATQIADFIASAAGNVAGNMASTDSPDSTPAAASSQSPDAGAAVTSQPSTSMIKTLTLSLEPDSLGTVTVTMRLADSGLDLQLEAAKSETTSLIEKDKGSLSDRLQTLGYSVDSLVVKTAAMQGTHQDPSNDQSAMGQGQQQAASDASASGLSQNGGRNANDQSPTPRGREAAAGRNQEAGSDPSASRTIGDGVYV